MPVSRPGGLKRGPLFDTNIPATEIDKDIFTDQEVEDTIAGDDLILMLDVSETPDVIKYMTRSDFTAGLVGDAITVTDNESTDENNLVSFVADAGTATGSHAHEMDGDFHYNPSTGKVTATTFAGALSGNATTATALASGRTIAMTGDVAWTSASFDGSGNVTGTGTIQADAVHASMMNTDSISAQTEITSGLAAEDELLYSDGGVLKRVGLDTLVSKLAGTGLSASSGVLAVSSAYEGDVQAVDAGVGISGGGTSGTVAVALDLSELTDTAIAHGDYIVFTDSTDSNASVKGDLADVATLFAGTGLTASSSVIGVDASQTQITAVGTIGTGVWQGTAIASGYIAADAITGAKIADDAIGSEHIADDAVVTAAIADDAITSALIADDAVVTAAIADDAITSALIADDAVVTAAIADDAITSALIADDAVVTAAIADNAITNALMADDAIDSAELAAGSVDAAHMSANSIDSASYVDGSIDTVHLAADVITGAKIADDAVDSEHYTDGSIDTAHIADNQITLAKMAGGTDGNIISYDASGDPVAIATGSDGQVLTSAGAGAPPAFETPTTGDITAVTAGVGLSGGGSSGGVTLTLDLSELSTVTPADGDFFSTLDSDGANEQKTTTTALATLFAGTGLTASSSVIGVDASQGQITTVGALNAGSITSGFTSIDVGAGAIAGGSFDASDGNITNVGDIALDSISADDTDINIAVTDNSATALTVLQGSDAYLIIDTANSSESVSIGTGISGTAIAIGHGTSEVTFGDNVTITGDLTINGAQVTNATTNLTVADPLVKYGQAYVGSAYDQGFIVTRGDGSSSNTQNMAFIWDESADEFSTIKAATEDGTTAGNVTVTDYVNLHVGAITADDTSVFSGSIELGHATDTTIARASSGDVNIEGNIIYRAGGTDVPVADGGTGASTLTDGGVLLGSGTGAITAMAVLADGEMIVGDGTADPVAESGATLRTSIGAASAGFSVAMAIAL